MTETTRTRRSPVAPAAPDPAVIDGTAVEAVPATSAVPQVSPRGTERLRRRKAQAEHAAQAREEGANLTSPSTPEKKEAIAKLKEQQLATFGPSKKTRREKLQAINKAKAEEEGATIVAAPEPARPRLVPGEQASPRTARLMAKQSDREERDVMRDAAKAAGLAVLDTLKGKPIRDRHNKFRRIAVHNAKQAKLRTQQTA